MFKTSIRNKLIILLLIATILPFGASITITYFYTKESLKDQVVQENSKLLYQGSVNLEGYFRELNGLSLSLYNNPDFLNFLKSPNSVNDYQTIDIVKDVLQTILYAEENIERVYISFAEDNGIISISKQSSVVFATQTNDLNQYDFLKEKVNGANIYIEPIHMQRAVDPVVQVEKPKNVISIHRAFPNIPSTELLAFITLEITPDKINELSRNLYNQGDDEFYILSPEGELIYSSDPELFNNLAEQEWIQNIVNSNEENGAKEWNEESFNGVMVYDKISELLGGWILVKRIPYTTLYQSVFNIAKINILFGVIGLILVVLATLFISFKITSPIRILLQNIHQVEKGNMQVGFQSLGKDEIGILGDRFKQMIEKINHHINKEYKLELENKTIQLRVLQSQINPHFLYNALQSIGTVALKNNVPQIYSLVTYLSKIMRYGMNTGEDIVVLSKELNYIESFLRLQKERFGEQLEYVIDVKEDARGIRIPKMLLQPIIENYFKHGFDTRVGIGRISLVGRVKGEELLIQVKDNGRGMTDQRLEEIYNHFLSDTSLRKGTNIGLKNVYSRLKLYYHDQATLQLQNNKEGGLLVTITLPIKVKGVNHESNHY